MKRFKNILCVTGDEPEADGAFQRALELARTNDAAMTVACVLPPAEHFTVGPMGWGDGLYPDLWEIREAVVDERRRGLVRLAEEAARQGVVVRTRLLEGRFFLELVREVLRGDHDLVMKVARVGSGRFRWFFGSDDHHLMRKCPVPVWLLDPARREEFRVVLAAVDVSTRERDPLDVKILELASSLARREGATLHVVHAWSVYEERYLRAHESEISHQGIRGLLRHEKEERRERLHALVEEVVPDAVPRVHLRKGDPARIVSLLARETGADVLVMGTLGRSGIPGFLIGNTAEAVLARVRCGVLTVKPDGFETPVRLEEGEAFRDRARGLSAEPPSVGESASPARRGAGS